MGSIQGPKSKHRGVGVKCNTFRFYMTKWHRDYYFVTKEKRLTFCGKKQTNIKFFETKLNNISINQIKCKLFSAICLINM